MSFGDFLQKDQTEKWTKIQHRLGMVLVIPRSILFLKQKNEDLIVQGSLQPMLDEGNGKHSIVGIFQDIAQVRQAEKERDRLFVYSIDMLCIVGYDGLFKRVNPAFYKTLGVPEEEYIRKPFMEFVHPEDKTSTLEEFSKLQNGIPSVCFETRCRHQDGSYRWLSWTAHPVTPERLIYAVARDVTEERNMKETLKQMAYQDTLTGLYNRRGFLGAAERMLKIVHRNKMGLLMMMADLDNMKMINDRFGHPEGDAALITIARILRERFRESDLVARTGGDEFLAALLTNSKDQSDVIGKSLENAFAEYNQEQNQGYPLSLSMGFAFSSANTRISINELITQADQAMYVCKRQRQLVKSYD